MTIRSFVPLAAFLFSALAGLAEMRRPLHAEDVIRNVGSEKVLFVDDAYFAESAGVEFKLHPPRKTGERILVPEHAWESATLSWFNVLKQDGKFRMWYECYDLDGWDSGDDTSFCYAESKDGLTWTKPKLGRFEYHGSRENNILFRQIGDGDSRSRVHGAGVFVDPNAPPDKRYKAVSQGLFRNVGDMPYWIAGMTSPDGLTWTRLPEPICRTFADSQYSAVWDEGLRQYVLFGRVGGRGRAIGRSQSDRFDRFAPLSLVLQAGDPDPPDSDLYNAACVRLKGANGLYLMFPSLFQYKSDTLDIRLAVSRDGLRWSRPDPTASFIPLGAPGEFDSGSLYMGQGYVEVGDELWFYYSGSPLKHGVAETLTKPANGRIYSRCVSQRDRLVSARTVVAGHLVTVPLTFAGSRLQLNLVVRPKGTLRVGLLDGEGKPIPGRSVEDCVPVTGDHLRKTIEWKDAADVSAWSGKPVRIRVEFQDADLFGLQFTNEDTP